jgi:hypothetical protein
MPEAALLEIPAERWLELGVSRVQTIEACLRRAGFV